MTHSSSRSTRYRARRDPERSGLPPKQIIIVGRRWFQRSYGNTYHSVQIMFDGDVVGSVPRAYGYGDQWKETGVEWLEKRLTMPPRDWQWLKRTGLPIEFYLVGPSSGRNQGYVPREKDLEPDPITRCLSHDDCVADRSLGQACAAAHYPHAQALRTRAARRRKS